MTAVRARQGGIDENTVPVRGPSPDFTARDGGVRSGNPQRARETPRGTAKIPCV